MSEDLRDKGVLRDGYGEKVGESLGREAWRRLKEGQ